MMIGCMGVKKDKDRCTRNSSSDSSYCWQHVKQNVNQHINRSVNPVIHNKSTSNIYEKSNLFNKPIQINTVNKVNTEVLQEYKSIEITYHDCCICLETNVDRLLDCKHAVCDWCLQQIRKPICPLCARDLKGPSINIKLIEEIKKRNTNDVADRESSLTNLNISSILIRGLIE
jgi:hypothetical protein